MSGSKTKWNYLNELNVTTKFLMVRIVISVRKICRLCVVANRKILTSHFCIKKRWQMFFFRRFCCCCLLGRWKKKCHQNVFCFYLLLFVRLDSCFCFLVTILKHSEVENSVIFYFLLFCDLDFSFYREKKCCTLFIPSFIVVFIFHYKLNKIDLYSVVLYA